MSDDEETPLSILQKETAKREAVEQLLETSKRMNEPIEPPNVKPANEPPCPKCGSTHTNSPYWPGAYRGCYQCGHSWQALPKEWQCPICLHQMTEEESQRYAGCPTGFHAVAHVRFNAACDVCQNWARADVKKYAGKLIATNHHPNCPHYNDSLMDVWKISDGSTSCFTDNEQDARDTIGEGEEWSDVKITKERMHREIFVNLPEFEGF